MLIFTRNEEEERRKGMVIVILGRISCVLGMGREGCGDGVEEGVYLHVQLQYVFCARRREFRLVWAYFAVGDSYVYLLA